MYEDMNVVHSDGSPICVQLHDSVGVVVLKATSRFDDSSTATDKTQ